MNGPRLADAATSVLLLVDLQPAFLAPIEGAEAVLAGARFLAQCAHRLGVRVYATEQNPERMGGTEPSLAPYLSAPPAGKMEFSAYGAGGFLMEWARAGVETVVVAGIETPICVTQTALQLVEGEYGAMVVADATGARSRWAHEAALARLASQGAVVTQAESVVYEWMGTAAHEAFRDVLELVKGRG